MANIEIRDGDGTEKYLKATGAGTTGDPFIPEHKETSAASILTAVQAIQTAVETLDNAISGSEMQVDIVSSALPSGAATSAKQDTIITAVQAIQTAVEILDNAISGSEMQVDVLTLPADPLGANADAAATAGSTGSISAKLRLVTSQLDAIKTAVETLDNAIGGSEMQVDIVSGSVSLTGNLPDTSDGALAAIKTAVELIDNAISGSEMQVDVVAALPAGSNTIGNTRDAGPSWTSVFGVSGARFTSSDQSSSAASVTDAPTAGQKLVITDVLISVDTAMRVDLKEETSGTVVASIYLPANGSGQITPRSKFKLATADKKLQVQTSTAGNVAVTAFYYSEA